MVTIKEIAQELGISPTTVSNVINGRTAKMSLDTRRRIEEALWENHYDGGSRHSIGSSEEKMIAAAFLIKDRENVLLDPFCAELLGAMESESKPYGRYLIYSVPSSEEDLIRLFSPWNVEGGILLGVDPDQCAQLQKQLSKPLVFIDSYFGGEEASYDNVGLQDQEGAFELTSYLLKQGHRSIAFFCDQHIPLASNMERFLGYKKALSIFGLSYSDRDFCFLPQQKNQRHEVLRQFVRKPDRHHTAAFFISDFYASEAINIFYSQGIRVPENLSVVGFDDNIYAKLSRPTLTTIRQSPSEKGKEAVRLLLRRIRGEEITVRTMQLPTELIVRESVKNIG